MPALTERRITAVIFGLIIAAQLFTLQQLPVNTDEAWHGSRAMGFIATGTPRGELDLSFATHFERYWLFTPLLPTVLYALPVALVGSVEIWALRIISLFFGAILLAAVYLIGQSCAGVRVGRWAMIVTGFSPFFTYAARVVRPDIIAAALGYLALALYLRGGKTRTGLAFTAGLLLALAFEFHPRSCIFGPVILLLYLIDLGPRALLSRAVWFFGLGAILGLSAYVLVHIAPDPQSYFGQAKLLVGESRMPAVAEGRLALALKPAVNMVLVLAERNRFGPWLFLAAALFVFTTGDSGGKRLFSISGLMLLCGTLLIRNPLYLNFIMVSPAAELLPAFLFAKLSDSVERPLFSYCHAGLVAAIAAMVLVLSPYMVERRYDLVCEPDAESNRLFVTTQLSAQGLVVGPPVHWLSRQTAPYRAWHAIPFLRHYKGHSVAEAFTALKPDYVIVDDSIRVFLRDDATPSPWYEDHRVPKQEFESFLASRGQLVAQKESLCFGNVDVYRFQW